MEPHFTVPGAMRPVDRTPVHSGQEGLFETVRKRKNSSSPLGEDIGSP